MTDAGPEESLAEAFRSAGQRLRSMSKDSLARWDITPAQSRALLVLGRHGAIRPSELSSHLHIAPRSATEVVDDLQNRGLVERAADPADRRATLLELTASGRRVLAQMRASRAANAERFFDRLTADERALLARLLHRLAE